MEGQEILKKRAVHICRGKFKGIFSDSNNILWHESKDINKTKTKTKKNPISVDYNITFSSYA